MSVAINPVRQFIDDEFPEAYRPLVPSALRRAYGKADALMGRIDFLGTPSGAYQRGDLIVKAAEYEFFKLIESGSLPFEPSWEDYAAPTGKHLVMRTSRARITINQVTMPYEKPRYAVFRQNFGMNNMLSLFPEWNEAAKKESRRRHLLLLHGYQTLRFANIAYPHATKNYLVDYTDNLMSIPHVIDGGAVDSKAEGPTESPDPEALDELLKFIRDDD